MANKMPGVQWAKQLLETDSIGEFEAKEQKQTSMSAFMVAKSRQ